jgi:hypothetical protein
LELATRFEDRLVLEPGERAEDVLAGAVAIAMRRAAMFGRAPVGADIELALELFGYLARGDGSAPPSELVAFRREQFAGADHDYWRRRALADEVSEEALRLSPQAVRERLGGDAGGWRDVVVA